MSDELIEGNIFDVERQTLSDSYLTFLPKNTAGYTTINQILDLSIPRTPYLLRLNKAYFSVLLHFGYKIEGDDFTQTTKTLNDGSNPSHVYIGLINSATMFDQIQINNNGKTILSDTFSQINSRIWAMSKSDKWIKAQEASFLNIDDVRRNENFILFEITDEDENGDPYNTDGTTNTLTVRAKIPLPTVFNCFENADNFYTTALVDDVLLSLQLSDLKKYMCVVMTDDNYKPIKIEPFDATLSWQFDGTAGHNITLIDDEDTYYIEQLKLVVPFKYADMEDQQSYGPLIENGAKDYNFKNFDIQAMSTDFTNTTTQSLNFTSNTFNISGIMVLFSHYYNNVLFDKPYIENIELNLNEIYKLANNKTHTQPTYTDDADLYLDLSNAFGSSTYKNFNRFDSAITKDCLKQSTIEDATAGKVLPSKVNLLGSYVQWFKVAPGNQIGISSDDFNNLIVYKYESNYDSTTPTNTPNNYADSTVFCCELSYRTLIYTNGGIDIITPTKNSIDVRNSSELGGTSSEPYNSSHGLAAAIAAPVAGLFGQLGNTITGEIHRIKGNKNTTYAYTTLGKDLYNKHKDIIEYNYNMGCKKFKKFINKLAAAEKQLNTSNGLVARHGTLDAKLNDTGAPGLENNTSGNAVEKPQPIDLSDLNLKHLTKLSYNAIIADKDYKMVFPVDYKWGLHRYKLRLNSWGNEFAAANIQHGFKDWIKRAWGKITGFFKPIGKNIVEGGKKLVENVQAIAKDYASQILSGKLNVKDVPQKFKQQVMSLLGANQLTGKPVDSTISQAIEMYKKIKAGQMKWTDLPSNLYSIVKNLSLSNNTSNGLVARHGFNPYINIKPSIPYSITKRRVNKLLDKNPLLLKQKELKRLWRFKHLASSGIRGYDKVKPWLEKNRNYYKLPIPEAISENANAHEAQNNETHGVPRSFYVSDPEVLKQERERHKQTLQERIQKYNSMTPEERKAWKRKQGRQAKRPIGAITQYIRPEDKKKVLTPEQRIELWKNLKRQSTLTKLKNMNSNIQNGISQEKRLKYAERINRIKERLNDIGAKWQSSKERINEYLKRKQSLKEKKKQILSAPNGDLIYAINKQFNRAKLLK